MHNSIYGRSPGLFFACTSICHRFYCLNLQSKMLPFRTDETDSLLRMQIVKLSNRGVCCLVLSFLLVCVVAVPVMAREISEGSSLLAELSSSSSPLYSASLQFNALNSRIRDNRISRSAARGELVRLLADIRNEYYRSGGIDYPASDWVFPLQGYDVRAVGGGRRHGYVPRGYDFYSGNRHGGHPSYDIFIRDHNHDSYDDRSGTAVPVLSITGGVVVALEREWERGSRLRGGRYIWVYDPANDLLVYYAHHSDISVTLGDIVKPGEVLGTVGRSGWNAAKKRSPTHLHLTVLHVTGGQVTPLNVYRDLVRVARGVAIAAL